MPNYRIYVRDKEGSFLQTHNFNAANEAAAIKLAERYVDGRYVEIWKGAQLIRRFEYGGEAMASKADTLRDDARYAGEEAKKAHSDDEGAMQRKRQGAMEQLAGNEDWLDGRTPSKAAKPIADK